VAEQAKSPPNETALAALDQSLTAAFNEMGSALASLLDPSQEEGSEKHPLPIDYPKRRAAAYPNIYVGPETAAAIGQDSLKRAAAKGSPEGAKAALQTDVPAVKDEDGFKKWPGSVKVFSAAGGSGQQLPNGKSVGLDPQFANLAPGKILVFNEKGTTGGGGKINDLFKPFGFRAGAEQLDGDHVMERQLGGPDDIRNLWPLPRGENRSSGATLKGLKVHFKGQDTTLDAAKQARKDQPLNLLIKSTVGE
jgi:hypothetical protein